MSLFKRRIDFRPGTETPEMFVTESNFRIHQEKMQESLRFITQAQVPRDTFTGDVVTYTLSEKRMSSEKIYTYVEHCVLPSESANTKKFLKNCEEVLDSIPLRESQISKHHNDVLTIIKQNRLNELRNLSSSNSDKNLQDCPELDSIINKFINSVDLSPKLLKDKIDILLSLAEVNETLTFLSSFQFIYIGAGLHGFFTIHTVLWKTGAFKYFLYKTKSVLQVQMSTFYQTIKVSSSFVYKYKNPIALGFGAFTGSFFLGYKLFHPTEKALSAFVLPNWAPENGVIVTTFNFLKNILCVPIYMGTNAVFSAYAAARQGILDALLPPEARKTLWNLVKAYIEDKKK